MCPRIHPEDYMKDARKIYLRRGRLVVRDEVEPGRRNGITVMSWSEHSQSKVLRQDRAWQMSGIGSRSRINRKHGGTNGVQRLWKPLEATQETYEQETWVNFYPLQTLRSWP